MENENIMENVEVSDTTDIVQPSEAGDAVTEEVIEDSSSSDSQFFLNGTDEDLEETEQNASVSESSSEGSEVVYMSAESVDYTEQLVLINSNVELASARIEYTNCLLIIMLLIVLMHYTYKFFKMFF